MLRSSRLEYCFGHDSLPLCWGYIYISASLSPGHILFFLFPRTFFKIKALDSASIAEGCYIIVQTLLPAQQYLCLFTSLVELSLYILGITISMAEETRYITVSGAAPNGGFPAGIIFAGLVGPPPAQDMACQGPPPPYTPPPQPVHPNPPLRQTAGGSMLLGDLTDIHWLDDGDRPCDAPNGYFPYQFDFTKYQVPSVMRVRDLIEHLEAPRGNGFGITQMEEIGNDTWVESVTIIRGSEMADRTLAELGWTQQRSQAAPIWLCMKRP